MTQADEFSSLVDAGSEKLFQDFATPAHWRAAERGEGWDGLWRSIEDSGFCDSLCADGVGPAERGAAAFAVLRNSGRALIPAPLGETMLARRIWMDAGHVPPKGAMTIGVDRAAYGRFAGHTVAELGASVALMRVTGARIQDVNVAGEPRDSLTVERLAGAGDDWTAQRLRAVAAMIRAAQMCGAIERVVTLTVDYARTRKQFGRPIGQFQAIQQALAVLAGHAAAASVATEFAFRCWRDQHAVILGPVAKVRAGEAAGAAISIAHQTFGAIGITHEHELHFATRRLHAWRAEYGGEGAWAETIGRWAAERGANEFWPAITRM